MNENVKKKKEINIYLARYDWYWCSNQRFQGCSLKNGEEY